MKIPIYLNINGFKGHVDSLKEIEEYAQLYDLERDYPNLAKGIFDESENEEFSKEVFSVISHFDDETLENIYKNENVEWKEY